jgi:hypothetical protein
LAVPTTSPEINTAKVAEPFIYERGPSQRRRRHERTTSRHALTPGALLLAKQLDAPAALWTGTRRWPSTRISLVLAEAQA